MRVSLSRFFLLTWLAPGFLMAQLTLSTIRGTATDPSGAVVAGAEITLVNLETNFQRSVPTSDSGDFEIPDLQRGTYRLTAAKTGFKNFIADNILIEGQQIRRINVAFELGAVGAEVTVRADAAVISTDTAKIQGAFTEQKYQDVPWVGMFLYPTLPLSTLPNVQTRGSKWDVSFAGQSGNQIQTGQDGHTNDGTGNQIINMPDIQELSAVTVNNSAEFSRVGYFNAITKSGSNQYHGEAAYWQQNSALAARSFFDPAKAKQLIHTNYGSASGPIFKDRTFFYAAITVQLIPSKSYVLNQVPTTKMRQGDFSQLLALSKPVAINDPLSGAPFPGNLIPASRLNPVSVKVQENYIPTPNQGGADALSRNYSFLFPYPSDTWRLITPTFRIDHKISSKNTLMGRFMQTWNYYVLPSSYSTLTWTRIRYANHLVLEDTHIVSPRLVNTFRMGLYTEKYTDGETVNGVTPPKGDQVVKDLGIQGVNPKALSAEGFPRMDIAGGYPTLRVQPGGVGLNDRDWGYADAVTWSVGRHVLKFGGEVKPQSRFTGTVPEGTYGSFNFNGTMTGYGFSDFLLGIPYSSQRLNPLTNRTQLDSEAGFYVQDSFKVNSRVTLEYGLRWDHFGPTSYDDGLYYNWDRATAAVVVPQSAVASISPLYPTSTIKVVTGPVQQDPSKRNFAPRFGVAWRPFGMNTVVRAGYGVYTEDLGRYQRLQGVGPFQISETFFNSVQNGQPLFAFPSPFPAGSGNIPSQSISGYPLNTENGRIHQFNFTLEHQVRDIGLRLSYLGSQSRGLNYTVAINKPEPSLIPFTASRRPYPQFVGASFTRSDGAANYNALTLEAQRKVGGLTFDAHWTWASSYANTFNLENPYAPLFWARDPYISRQRAVLNVVWELPFGKGRRYLATVPGVVNHVVGGWQLYWIAYLQTGQFFSPGFSGSDPSNTNTSGGLPDRIANGNLPSGQRSVDHWFDPSAFVVPPAGRFGNSGVDVLEGPGMHLHNLSLVKGFPITERIRLTYVAAMTNVLNHPNFANPSADISSPASVGIISSVTDYSGFRQMEMRLRLTF